MPLSKGNTDQYGITVAGIARVIGSDEPYAIAAAPDVHLLVQAVTNAGDGGYNQFFTDLNSALTEAYGPDYPYAAWPGSPVLLTEIPKGIVVVLLPREVAAALPAGKRLYHRLPEIHRVFVLDPGEGKSFMVDRLSPLTSGRVITTGKFHQHSMSGGLNDLHAINEQLVLVVDELTQYVEHGRCGDQTAHAAHFLQDARVLLGIAQADGGWEQQLELSVMDGEDRIGLATVKLWQVALLLGESFEEFLAGAARKHAQTVRVG
jgi:hypothetical protein